MMNYRDLLYSKSKCVKIDLTYRSTEQGAVLIVVLLFLVLIMLAGAIAVKQSNTDLKMATGDQINTVILQSSDSANQKLESMLNDSDGSPGTEHRDVISATGIFGHFILNEENTTNEFIYCFNPRTKKYFATNATVLTEDGKYWSNTNNGTCDYTKAEDYTSARQTVMTQMSVTTTPIQGADPFSHVVIGKEIQDKTSKRYRFDLRATSALPAYSAPKVDSDNCFEKTSIEANVKKDGISLNDCMKEAKTPSKMLYEQVDVENVSSSTVCIPFGKGKGSSCALSTKP